MANLQQRKAVLERARQRSRMRRRAVSILGTVVVLATALALMLPAISMTRDTAPEGSRVTYVAGAANFDSASSPEGSDADGAEDEAAGSPEGELQGDAAGDQQDGNSPAQAFNQEVTTATVVAEPTGELASEREAFGLAQTSPSTGLQVEAVVSDNMAVTVSVEAPEGALPAGATMRVAPVTDAAVLEAAVQEAVTDAAGQQAGLDAALQTTQSTAQQAAQEAATQQATAQQATTQQATAQEAATQEAATQEATAQEAAASGASINAASARAFAVDIAFVDVQGNEIEPQQDVSVTITAHAVSQQGNLAVVHIDDDNNATVVPIDEVNAKDEQVVFSSDAFSVYAIVYTVDFEYEKPGDDGEEPQVFRYTIEGGSTVALVDVLKALNVVDDSTSADFMQDIETVVFSNSDLVEVVRSGKILGLFGEESWTLESLQPFDTEEILVITLKDGTAFTIVVTDAQYTNLADFVTDAALEIDGKTYGAGTTWNVREDVDYTLKLTFAEKGSRQLPSGGDEVVMEMPAGMTLEPGTSGTFDIPCGLAGTLEGNTWWVDGDGKLHVQFADDPDSLLTRSSNIHFDLEIDAKFDGTQTHFEFNDNVTRDAQFDTSTNVDVSKTGSYNASTGKMEYTLTVKATGAPTNVNVSDTISGDMLTLDASSISIEPTSKTPSSQSSTSKGFNMTFASMSHNETVTIKYTASVDTTKVGTDGKVTVSDDGKNTVTVTDDQDDSSTATNIVNEIKYSTVSKSSTSSTTTTDETTGGTTTEVEWKIVANDNLMGSLVGSTITDKIDWNSKDIMSYPSPLNLNVVIKDASGNTVTTLEPSVTPTTDSNGVGSWSYTIPQVNSANEVYSYEITYKTIVQTPENTTTVKNDVTNEKGGSSSGSGIVEGTNPSGGSSSGGGDEIVTAKTAKTVTEDYIDWDIVINVPAEGFPDGLVVVDDLPYGQGNITIDGVEYNGFADTLAGEPTVSGLVNDESWSYELITSDDKHFTRGGETYERQILTINFYQDQDKTNVGLDAQARTVTITIRTLNDKAWMAYAATRGGGDPAYYHYNNAKVNNTSISAYGIPLSKAVEKSASEPTTEKVEGVSVTLYEYAITLANVTELPVVITDTFDSEYLQYYDSGNPSAYHDTIAAAEQKHNLNQGVYGYTASYEVSGGTLTITVNDLPKKQDGSYYEYYRVYYRMKLDPSKLDDLKAQALANGGTYQIGNTAVWGDVSDDYDIDYTVPGLSKTGYFAKDKGESSNERQYTFMLDVNREALTMNNDVVMELTDEHTSNLSVDYSSIKVYKITNGQSFGDATQYTLTDDMLTSEVTWNFDGNLGTFYVPDGTHYIIKYNALVIGSGSQTIANVAEMKGFSDSKTETRDFGSSSSAGGDIYQIKLLKYENGMTSNGLQGAVFQLFKGTGVYNQVTDGTYTWYEEEKEPMKWGVGTETAGKVGENITFTTDANGYALIALDQTRHGAELEEGVHYFLKEVDSPAGYQIDSSVEYWAFTLTKDPDEVSYGTTRDEHNIRQWIYFYYDDILKMANTPTTEPLDVVVNKTWYDEDGNEITGENLDESFIATVQLMRKTDDGDYKRVKVETDASGSLVVTELDDDSEDGYVQLNSSNSWAYTWSQLPRVEMGGDKGLDVVHRFAYRIEEISVDGYVYSIDESENETTKTYALKNYKVPSENTTTELTVAKQWQDSDGETIDGTSESLPDSIRFYIYQVASTTPFAHVPSTGGSKYIISGDTHLLSSDDTSDNYGVYELSKPESSTDSWSATFSDLPSVVTTTSDGASTTMYYAYYVKEVSLAGYTTTYVTDGTTRTIVNKEPLPEGEYANISLEKRWTDGTGETPPSGATATFTVHQQKSTKSGVEGDLTVNLVDSDDVLISTLKASDGNTLSISDYHFASWSPGSTFQAQVNYAKEETWGTNWQYVDYLEESWDGNIRTVTFDVSESTMAIDKTITLKLTRPKSDFSDGPLFSNASGQSVSYSGYEDTSWTREIALPTTAGNWSTTVKDLIVEDEYGNLYRYYITEDSCSPSATAVAFVDGEGANIKDDSALGNQTTATLDASGQSVVVTNTYEIQGVTVTVNKVAKDDLDAESPSTLPGATFSLQKYTSSTYDEKDSSWTAITKSNVENGVFTFDGLTSGYYELEETETPDGYIRTTENPRFRVNDDDGTLSVVLVDSNGNDVSSGSSDMVKVENATDSHAVTVGNTPGAELPSTGGPGVAPVMLLGGAFVALGLALLVRVRRRALART